MPLSMVGHWNVNPAAVSFDGTTCIHPHAGRTPAFNADERNELTEGHTPHSRSLSRDSLCYSSSWVADRLLSHVGLPFSEDS